MCFFYQYRRRGLGSLVCKYIGFCAELPRVIKLALLLLCSSVLLLCDMQSVSLALFSRSNENLLEMESYVSPCVPKHHIMFLKTHKCASSTVQNIFLRYGYNYNLTFALPEQGNYLGNPAHFKYSMIPAKLLRPTGKVDIFAVHSRLSSDHNKVVHNDSIWVTVVRDPVFLYESLYRYFHLKGFYKLKIEELANLPIEKLLLLPRYADKLGKNQMLFDLGFDDNISVADLKKAITEIENKFHLIMISELLDESLILLRQHLCWSLHDIVFFTKNVRRKEVRKDLPEAAKKKIRLMNNADSLLYEHFLKRHKLSVLKFGRQRMAEEVGKLRGLRVTYFEGCGAKIVKGRDRTLKYKEYSGLVSAYVLSNNTDMNCFLLSLPELPLIETIRKYQRKYLNNDKQ